MGKRRHKRRAEQHIPHDLGGARLGNAQWRWRAFGLCWLAAMAILAINIFVGTPDTRLATALETIAIIAVTCVSINVLVIRILPAGTWRSRGRVFWGGVTGRGYGGYYPYYDIGDLDVTSSGAVPPETEPVEDAGTHHHFRDPAPH